MAPENHADGLMLKVSPFDYLLSVRVQRGAASGTGRTNLVFDGFTDGTGNSFGELATGVGWNASNFKGNAIAAGNTLMAPAFAPYPPAVYTLPIREATAIPLHQAQESCSCTMSASGWKRTEPP